MYHTPNTPNKRHKLNNKHDTMSQPSSLLQRKKLRSFSVVHSEHTGTHNNNDIRKTNKTTDNHTIPSFPVHTQSLPLSIDTVNLTHSPTTVSSAHVYSTAAHCTVQSPNTCSPVLLQRRASLSSSGTNLNKVNQKQTKPTTKLNNNSLLQNASINYVNTTTSDNTGTTVDSDLSTIIYDENSHLPASQSNDSIASINVLTQRILTDVTDDTDTEIQHNTLTQRRPSSTMSIDVNSIRSSPTNIETTPVLKPLFVNTVIDEPIETDDTIIDNTTVDTVPTAQAYMTPQHSPKHSTTIQQTPTRSARKTLTNDINQLLSQLNNNIAPEYSKRLQSPGHSRKNTMHNINKKSNITSPFLSRTSSRLTSPLHGRSPAVSRPQSPTRHSMISPRQHDTDMPGSATNSIRRSDRRLFDTNELSKTELSKPSPKRTLLFDTQSTTDTDIDTLSILSDQTTTSHHMRSPGTTQRTVLDSNYIQPMRSLNHSSLYQSNSVAVDRFIPSRTASHLDTARAESPPKPTNVTNSTNNDGTQQTTDSKDAHYMATYSTLLKIELLGGDVTSTSRRNSLTGTNNNTVRSSTPHTEQSTHGTPQRRPRTVQATTPPSGGITSATNKIRTFSFRSPAKSTSINSLHDAFNQSLVSKQSEKLLQQRTTPPRKIQRTAYRVLDAPQLKDDYYLNLVDWSEQNCIGVALGSAVYIWNANTSRVTKLLQLYETNHVCSLQWSRTGNTIAVGTKHGSVHLWDVATQQQIRSYDGHTARVSTLAFNYNMLASGSRDRNIILRDARIPDTEHSVSILRGHKQEVCGLKWSPDDLQLASGGNDNRLYVWNVKNTTMPQLKFCDHRGAVKAIAWSPHQTGLLCSGGGTADKHIRFWNTLTSTTDLHSNNPLSPLSPTTPDLYNRNLSDVNERSMNRALHSVDTGSQVCQLAWSNTCNEIVSTHGYSLNQIIVWKYNHHATTTDTILQPISTLTGHSMRVLYLAVSPDGQSIVTGAGDETLRFWNIFPAKNSDDSKLGSPLKLPNMNCIR